MISGAPVLTGDINMTGYTKLPLTFTAQNQLSIEGVAEDYITIQFHVTDHTYIPGWTLKVRASDAFRNVSDMKSSLDPGLVSLSFNRVDLGQPLSSSLYHTQLSTSEMTLISHEKTPLQPFESEYNIQYTFNMIISGGDELLNMANGTYMTSLDFFLYDSGGALISTTSIPNVFFIVSVVPNNEPGIQLSNMASFINLNFFTAKDYAEGLSVFIPAGITIKGNKRFSVYVRSNSDNLVSASGHSIPASAIKVRITINDTEENPVVTVFSPVELSSSAQLILSKKNESNSYRNVSYNLEFYTEGGDHALLTAEGTYSAVLYFLLLPE